MTPSVGRDGPVSPTVAAREARRRLFAVAVRTCSCPEDADAREERTGLECACGAPIVRRP